MKGKMSDLARKINERVDTRDGEDIHVITIVAKITNEKDGHLLQDSGISTRIPKCITAVILRQWLEELEREEEPGHTLKVVN